MSRPRCQAPSGAWGLTPGSVRFFQSNSKSGRSSQDIKFDQQDHGSDVINYNIDIGITKLAIKKQLTAAASTVALLFCGTSHQKKAKD